MVTIFSILLKRSYETEESLVAALLFIVNRSRYLEIGVLTVGIAYVISSYKTLLQF